MYGLKEMHGRHVLAIQDTTTLRDDGGQNSLNPHAMIAVDARDGALLGPVHAEFLRHLGGRRAERGKRPFEEKESFRWLAATREAGKLIAAGATGVTVVADRECDIHDEFALRPPNVDLVIRVRHDRVLADGRRLSIRTRGLAELGRETITLPDAPARRARDAVIALRAGPVTLKRPMRDRAADAAKLPAKVHLTLVEAREVKPPPGTTPAHWLLLTTHAVARFAAARRITRFYRGRGTGYYGQPGPIVIPRGLLLFKAMRRGCEVGLSMRSGPKRYRSDRRGNSPVTTLMFRDV